MTKPLVAEVYVKCHNLSLDEEELLDRIIDYIKQVKILTNKHEYYEILKELERKLNQNV